MSTFKVKQSEYLPVAWEYVEIIEKFVRNQKEGKVFFFDEKGDVGETFGKIMGIEDRKNEGMFIELDRGVSIRIDRIITLFGKIGAAYDLYNAYADACMDCLGGYEKDEL
ncbi:hypothetical protein [Sphingobacterium suaedae]|uniref:Uncharacterized protein n=1 Tax=Sphingobacterium suaedae TaxID=1686402 RepID=A0ABW5KFA2_9SPHI